MALGDGAMANFRGVKLAEKKGRFRGLYITGAMIFFASATIPNVGIGIALGFFMLVFTGLAHLVVKVVAVQNQITGDEANSAGISPMFQSRNHSSFAGGPHYNHMIRKLQSQSVRGMTADQAATQYASFFTGGRKASQPFFSNPQVQAVLGIMPTHATQAINSQPAKPVTAESAATSAFWSSMPESSEPATEVCGNSTCTTPVNVFDFRCFNCRKRFCNGCKGDKITCPSCS